LSKLQLTLLHVIYLSDDEGWCFCFHFRRREYMVRVIYCEMLGHDASFAYIPALQLASDPNLLTKKVRCVAAAAAAACILGL
jgi:hypothetical protein